MSLQQYPKCPNKNQGRLVCLNERCQMYPFFCTTCQEQKCQGPHHHSDKLTSVGFKQFIKKVLPERKPPQELIDAIQKYRKVLDKLQADVDQFVKKQQQELQEILRKMTQMDQSQMKIIKKLRDKQYQSLIGKDLDHLWYSVINYTSPKGVNQIIQFLESKEEEIKVMSQNFEIINQMELGMDLNNNNNNANINVNNQRESKNSKNSKNPQKQKKEQKKQKKEQKEKEENDLNKIQKQNLLDNSNQIDNSLILNQTNQ